MAGLPLIPAIYIITGRTNNRFPHNLNRETETSRRPIPIINHGKRRQRSIRNFIEHLACTFRAGPRDRPRELVLVQNPDSARVIRPQSHVRRPSQRRSRPDRPGHVVQVRGLQQAAARLDGRLAGERAGDNGGTQRRRVKRDGGDPQVPKQDSGGRLRGSHHAQARFQHPPRSPRLIKIRRRRIRSPVRKRSRSTSDVRRHGQEIFAPNYVQHQPTGGRHLSLHASETRPGNRPPVRPVRRADVIVVGSGGTGLHKGDPGQRGEVGAAGDYDPAVAADEGVFVGC
ncbi:hypothetical protein LINPERHAP1_LOCUS40640 [Linum perenne]